MAKATEGTTRRFKRGDRVRLIDSPNLELLEDFDLELGDLGVVQRYVVVNEGEPEPPLECPLVDFGRGPLCVDESDIAPAPGSIPRYTRLAALDTVAWLYRRRCRSRRAGELWRRLEKLLDQPIQRRPARAAR
jgi:hypothetical protein